MADLQGKNVAMVVAYEQFRDEELLQPRALLERRGAAVTVVSTQRGTATGKLGARVPVDAVLGEVRVEEFDGIVFVGGPGCKALFKSRTCHDLARQAIAAGKILAAICSAGGILAEAGVLADLPATCYPTEAELLRAAGAHYTARPLERVPSGQARIVTADGPQSATLFGAAIADALAEAKA
ncbi:MAG: DJ-1/PfpI family protein [Cyanobacteria bacterium REEB65]|nr:DJ-1/PfpI family protein [Cyanobacteria bacterium REEB65]